MPPAQPSGAFLLVTTLVRRRASEHQKIFQRRGDADHDGDDASDLFAATVERRHADEIQNKNNDEKRNQDADEHCYFSKIDHKIQDQDFKTEKAPSQYLAREAIHTGPESSTDRAHNAAKGGQASDCRRQPDCDYRRNSQFRPKLSLVLNVVGNRWSFVAASARRGHHQGSSDSDRLATPA
jgi:hypothetical protein